MPEFPHYRGGHPPPNNHTVIGALKDHTRNGTTSVAVSSQAIPTAPPPALPSPSSSIAAPSLPNPSLIHPGFVDDLRALPYAQRYALISGSAVQIYDDTIFAMTIPHALFLAASTEPRLINAQSQVRLPPATGVEPILTFCNWLVLTCICEHPVPLQAKKHLKNDLLVCRAARLLGMERYVLHIHNYYWWKLCNKPFTAQDVQHVIDVAVGMDDCFLRLIAQVVAARRREGAVVDKEAMETWIEGNPMLRALVERQDAKFEKGLKLARKREERIQMAMEERKSKEQNRQAQVEVLKKQREVIARMGRERMGPA